MGKSYSGNLSSSASILAGVLFAIAPAFSFSQECVSGREIPGSYIVKIRKPATTSSLNYMSASQIRRAVAHDLKVPFAGSFDAIDPLLTRVEGNENYKEILENAVSTGVLEYAEPNRQICLQDAGFTIKGQVRVKGASTEKFPRIVVIGSDQTLTALNFQQGQGIATELTNRNEIGTFERTPFSFRRVILNANGIPDFLSDISLKSIIPGIGVQISTSARLISNTSTGQFALNGLNAGSLDLTNIDQSLEIDDNDDGAIDQLFIKRASFGLTADNHLYRISKRELRRVALFPSHPVGIGDLNGDGRIDVLTAGRERGPGDRNYTRYSVFLRGTGDQFTLGSQALSPESGESNSALPEVVFADLNGDRQLDFISRYSDSGFESVIWVHTNLGGAQAFEESSGQFGGGAFPLGRPVVADFDLDGLDDVAYPQLAAGGSCSNQILLIAFGDRTQTFKGVVSATFDDCLNGLTVENALGRGPDLLFGSGNRLMLIGNNTSTPGIYNGRINTVSTESGKVRAAGAIDISGIANAKIALTAANGTTYSTVSNSNGEFRLSAIPAGNYTISAQHESNRLISSRGGSLSINSSISDLDFDALQLIGSPDGFVRPTGATNDEGFGRLWGLYNDGQTGGIRGVDTNILNAWQVTKGSPDVVVAVLDSGTAYNHPDLEANMWRNPGETPGNNIDDDGNGVIDDVVGFNAVDNNGDPQDLNGHGSHVAGTVGAVGDNNLGVVGVAPEVRVMAVRAGDATGGLSDAAILGGLDYIAKMRDRGVNVRVVNASFGGYVECQQFYLDALGKLDRMGISFIAAAGNGDNQGNPINTDDIPNSPANCESPNVVSVAAIESSGNLDTYSNFGVRTVDIAAPGGQIASTWANGTYNTIDGTSMAAPHIAGIAALMYSVNSSLTPREIREGLLSTSRKMNQLAGKIVSGGLVDAAASVQYARGLGVGPTPIPQPTPTLRPSATPQAPIGTSQLKNLVPNAAILKRSKSQLAITLMSISGARFEITLKVTSKAKRKNSSSQRILKLKKASILLKGIQKGSVVAVRYRIAVGSDISKFSPVAKLKF